MSNDRFTDLVRMNEAQRQALLDRLEFNSTGVPGGRANRRSERRIDYRRDRVPILIEHPGGGVSRLLVCARNLSGGGISFIHGGFVHSDSVCRLVLFRNDGTPEVITGTVRSCRNLRGQLHEVGVRFDHRIDLALFVPSDDAASAGGGAVSLSDLCGVVLASGFSALDQRLFGHVARESAIRFTFVPGARDAAARVTESFVDIVLVETGPGGDSGWPGIRAIRDAGFEGPLAAFAPQRSSELLASARAAGADELVGKPIDQTAIVTLLIKLHTRAGAVLTDGPLVSSLEERPDTWELIRHYTDQAHAAGHGLLEGLRERNLEAVREICLALKGTAAGYGFPTLSSAANAALERLESSASVTAAAPAIRRLQLMCASVGLRGDVWPDRGSASSAA